MKVCISPRNSSIWRDISPFFWLSKYVASSKENLRILEVGNLEDYHRSTSLRSVDGGWLLQEADEACISISDCNVVTKRKPTDEELEGMDFGWKVVKHVKSNAILFTDRKRTVGIGAGQMSRIYSAKIAGIKAADENLEVKGSVMASDAFFPFRDGIDAAAQAGIKAIIHPGGSMRDDEVIAAAKEHGIAMIFTGMRHFKH